MLKKYLSDPRFRDINGVGVYIRRHSTNIISHSAACSVNAYKKRRKNYLSSSFKVSNTNEYGFQISHWFLATPFAISLEYPCLPLVSGSLLYVRDSFSSRKYLHMCSQGQAKEREYFIEHGSSNCHVWYWHIFHPGNTLRNIWREHGSQSAGIKSVIVHKNCEGSCKLLMMNKEEETGS